MSKRDAYDQLAEQVKASREQAVANAAWGMELGLLREAAISPALSTWANPYPAGDPRSLLLEYQYASFHDRERFKAQLQARQTGKDFTCEGEAVTDCFERPGTQWMIAAPSERQALDSLDQAKLWAEAYDYHIEDLIEERDGGSGTLLKSAEIVYANGSRQRAVPGKPDTVRGRSANVLLTEFDFFENPDATWRAILPSITNPLRGGLKKVRLVSTPNGKGSPMHKIMTKADSQRMKWSRWVVTIYHAVMMGLPVDWQQIQEAMDDPEGWAQEYELQFLDSNNVLLPYEIIALAESAEAREFGDPLRWETRRSNPVVLGIDFGRTNDPSVCWELERVQDVWWTREVWSERGMSTPDQQRHLRRRIKHADKVCFDYTGPGIGLGDLLVEEFGEWNPAQHKFGKIELCTFTVGLKRHMFPTLRRAFEAPTKLRIPISTSVREDLHEMRQIVRNGEYTYSAPRTAEGHSDRCTALALAWRAAGDAVIYVPPPKPFSNANRFTRTASRSNRSIAG
jgi:phage FluMu gp28-like protein